jgi:hypothetical protein
MIFYGEREVRVVRGRGNNGHIRNESITTSWKRLNVSRIVGGVAERSPKLCDGYVDGLIKIPIAFVWPYSVAQFIAGNHRARAFQQYLQQLQGLLLHPDPCAGFAEFSRLETQFIGPEPNDLKVARRLHAAPEGGRS